jgi:hypothetical protein
VLNSTARGQLQSYQEYKTTKTYGQKKERKIKKTLNQLRASNLNISF